MHTDQRTVNHHFSPATAIPIPDQVQAIVLAAVRAAVAQRRITASPTPSIARIPMVSHHHRTASSILVSSPLVSPCKTSIVAPELAQQLSSRHFILPQADSKLTIANSQSQSVGRDRYNFRGAMHECKYLMDLFVIAIESTTNGFCSLKVTTFNNETYATTQSAPGFSVTWQFDPGPSTQPVHAFPNIMVDDVLPIELDKMTKVDLDLHWTYGVGNTVASSTDSSSLTADDLQTNVAIDMFFDSDKNNAGNSALAKYEVMVWFADFGASAQPIGLSAGAVTTKTLNGTTL